MHARSAWLRFERPADRLNNSNSNSTRVIAVLVYTHFAGYVRGGNFVQDNILEAKRLLARADLAARATTTATAAGR